MLWSGGRRAARLEDEPTIDAFDVFGHQAILLTDAIPALSWSLERLNTNLRLASDSYTVSVIGELH